MNKIRAIIIGLLITVLIPFVVNAATFWTGNAVLKDELKGHDWGIQADNIIKENNPGRVYSIDDLSVYSAYITNIETLIGNEMERSFYWYNNSRLGYVKLIKVKPGQEVSFLFSAERYVYLAEYDKNYTLLKDGEWITTGDKLKLLKDTEWVMMVFRNPNGDLDKGAGVDVPIKLSDITDLSLKYMILEPFQYTMNLNGGTYGDKSGSFIIERLGVSKLKLPVPVRENHDFVGWRAKDGKLYSGEIPIEYNEALFNDTSLEAIWVQVHPQRLELDRANAVLDKDSKETFHINATIYPENTSYKKINWSSSDNNVATVDADGNVTPISPGKAVITATTVTGIKQTCTIYVMGFEVTVPSYCSLDENHEIKINIFYNGESGMTNRKHVVLKADESVELVRVGDSKTRYDVLAESSLEYNGKFNNVGTEGCLIDTMESTSVYYRLKSSDEIKKSGDYEGNVTFTVSVY